MDDDDFAFLKYHEQLSGFVKILIDAIENNEYINYTIKLENGTINMNIPYNGIIRIPRKK